MISPANGSDSNSVRTSERRPASFCGIRFKNFTTELSISIRQFTFKLRERNRFPITEIFARSSERSPFSSGWSIFGYNARFERLIFSSWEDDKPSWDSNRSHVCIIAHLYFCMQNDNGAGFYPCATSIPFPNQTVPSPERHDF